MKWSMDYAIYVEGLVSGLDRSGLNTILIVEIVMNTRCPLIGLNYSFYTKLDITYN